MLVDDVILFLLASWVVPMVAFIFYFITDPVPGHRWLRKLIDLRTLKPISWILLVQKAAFTLVVLFILVVRFTGGFPGREWVAFGLYTLIVLIAWAALVDLRALQRQNEPKIRGTDKPPVN